MKKSNSYWDKRALERYDATDLKTDKATERIKKIYRQAYHNIEKELESVYKNYSNSTGIDQQKLKEILSKSETEKTFKQLKRQGLDKYVQDNYKARINRLEQIKAQIYAKAKMIYPKEELAQTMLYESVLNDNYYKTVYDTQMGTGYNFSFSQLDKNTMNTLLSENWSGKHYSERIWKNTDILAERLSTVVSAGLMSGQSIEKMARQIRNDFNTANYYAERLVRTESNYFHNQADMLAYQEMGVDKYVFVATLDNRTSEICQEMDNKKFDYDKIEVGVNYPPMHPNCRSTTRGYLGDEAEKMLKRRARNPITGKTEIVDNVPYKEWISRYPKDQLFPLQALKNSDKSDIIDLDGVKKISKSKILNMKTSQEVKDYFKDKHNIVLDNFGIVNIKELKVPLAGVDDFITEFKDAGNFIKTIRFSPNIRSYGSIDSKGEMVIGKHGLASYKTGVHESAHALDFSHWEQVYSKEVTQTALKNLKIKPKSKKDYKLREQIAGIRYADEKKESYREVFAYSIESEYKNINPKNILSKEIFKIVQGGKNGK